MIPKIKNLQDLLSKFSDEDVCRQYLVDQSWNGSPICPYCECGKSYKIEGGKRFKCSSCLKKYSVTVGTVFENSNIPLRTWFAAMYLISAHKKGISSLQLSRDLGVTQKTAWFMLHRIREALREKNSKLLVNEVQADETYIGGKEINRHKSKKSVAEDGVRFKSQAPVVGLLETGGKIVTKPVEFVSRKNITKIIQASVDPSAKLITDASTAYRTVGKSYEHIVINHSKGEYTLNGFHTNGIENFWSLLKRGIVGIYHSVSPKHLHRYCDEFSYRYNSRKIKDNERFEITLAQLNGRLKYKDLING